jgi:hypothetical protein
MNNRHETIDATTEGENVSLASVELKTTNAKTVVYKVKNHFYFDTLFYFKIIVFNIEKLVLYKKNQQNQN